MEILTTAQITLQLSRYPEDKLNLLRAWDAADEYLLNYLSETLVPKAGLNILIVNDSFGALSTALENHHITLWTDSYLAEQATRLNLEQNDQSPDKVEIIHSTETPRNHFDFILIKIPKTLALLEDQLARLRPVLKSETVIIAAAMVKAIHTSTLQLFEKYIGPTQTSLAKKKSRLIHSQLDETLTPGLSPYPTTYLLEGTEYTITNHANVFSRASLDIGTRFFLQHLPRSEKYQRIIDLACGNGVVGLMAAEKNPQAELFFLDESYMAIASAEENFRNVFSENRHAVFKVSDGLQGIEKHSVDLILNNPPFHQQHSVTDEVAWNMFQQSKAVLKQGGELWVIGNRHLGYHVKLKKLFGNCKIIANNKKFVILQASKK